MTAARTPSQRGKANRRNPDYGDSRLPQRFWDKVHPCPTSGCWLWSDRPQGKGYGQFRTGARRPVAHRYLWLTLVGPLDEEIELDHLCRTRSCVNPDHLEPVTASVNVRRGVSVAAHYARRDKCSNGHPFTPENTYRRSNGARECATCTSERMRRRRAAQNNGPSPAAVNAAKTHCSRGHELAGANLRVANGRRHCRACGRDRMRVRRAAG